MTTNNNTSVTLAATMTAEEFLFDRLETYYDCRGESPAIAAKALLDLRRACDAVRHKQVAVTKPVHKLLISKIIGEVGFAADRWELSGFNLGVGAQLLLESTKPAEEVKERLAKVQNMRAQAEAYSAEARSCSDTANELMSLADQLEKEVAAFGVSEDFGGSARAR